MERKKILVLVDDGRRVIVGKIDDGAQDSDYKDYGPVWLFESEDYYNVSKNECIEIHQPLHIIVHQRGPNEVQRVMHAPFPSPEKIGSLLLFLGPQTSISNQIPKDIERQYFETTTEINVPPPPRIIRPVQ